MGTQLPLTETSTATPHIWLMFIVAKRSPISATAELLFYIHYTIGCIYLVNTAEYIGDGIAADAVQSSGGDVTGNGRQVPA